MNQQEVNQKQKEAAESLNLTNEVIISWLGEEFLVQTFEEEGQEELDLNEEIRVMRDLLDE